MLKEGGRKTVGDAVSVAAEAEMNDSKRHEWW